MEIEQALDTMRNAAKMLTLSQICGVPAEPKEVMEAAGAILTKSIGKIEHMVTTRKIVKEEIDKAFGHKEKKT